MQGRRSVNCAAKSILEAPAFPLGKWPTPISTITPRGQAPFFVKRDDLSGHGRSGVKTRKIENLIGHMLDREYTALVTAVGNVTNLLHDILPVLDSVGIAWEIVVADDPPLPEDVRRSLFSGLGAAISLRGPSHVGSAVALVQAMSRSRRMGRRPMLTLPSLAHPAGVIGGARGFFEMVDQVDAMGAPPLDTVFITAASGTTLAGLLLAERLLRLEGHRPIQVIGVQVYPGPIRLWVQALVRWTERHLRMRDHLQFNEIDIRSSSLDLGFGRYSPELARLCRQVQEEHGIDIDPIFGGKTWTVMESYRAQCGRRGSVLYWHCGYTPQWQDLGRWANAPGR